ncbi:phosphatidylinositol N-acetylglucosaminyltransferase subunit Q-like isoform X2 [Tubulanus polymorphus]
MVWLMRNDRHNQIAHTVITSALNLITELHRLLSWIMGFPAGLKLNNHLVQFLGKFFTYHNYLWTGYMHLLQPLLGRVLWYGSLFGCLGLSMQLSFTYDLLSMMTLHIYCFYVYAARLYSLEVSMLSSLFRLFRGKKWNVLRKRVDSASYDIDQLFIGTLLFTVLLFILPTLIVYYVAFTALRLLVVIIHGILCQIIHLLNTVPVASLLLRIICHSSLTIGDINFQVYRTTQQDDQHQIIMAMQVVQLSVSEIYRKYKQKTLVKKQTYSWSELIRRLSLGHIIYPWIPRAEDDADIMTPRASG